MAAATEEKLEFQAEVSRLLNIVANALYSHKEIFLRELISNASDACDRLRYEALTTPALTEDDPRFSIDIAVDGETKTLTVSDNGIGMNRDDLIANLGTLARSGTAAFIEQLGGQRGEVDLIGQFGVGFYSSFMVADLVTVDSRRAGEAEGWRWTSDGQGGYTVVETDEAPARGSRITLQLKEGSEEFLDANRLRRIVKTYSDHIAVPIRLLGEDEPETVNSAGALWMRPKSEISDEQYREFYHHVAHAVDEPWLRLHFKVEGVMEYSGLLFVPSSPPFDLFEPDRKHRVKLYVKRVFITDDCAELLPPYLRFLRGIVDSEDLPLNISREMLQHNPMLGRMRGAIVKRVLNELEAKAKNAPEEYASFWENFGAVLKEGLYEDQEQRQRLLGLARFRTTAGEGWVSLAEYVERMKDGQTAIYTITGDDAEALKKSPQLEGFAAKGVEVLLLTDPIDEFWLPAIGAYQDKPFQSVTRAGADLDAIDAEEAASEDDDASEDESADDTALATLVAYVKTALADKVKDVRLSKRLTSSPVCLAAEAGDLDLHLERMLRQHNRLEETASRVLELNPKHPLVRRMASLVASDGAGTALEDLAHLLLDQARILEGEGPLDPSAFARRLSSLAEKGLG
jgi:molecular chaperone HtpG